jgi:hypothetical protein
MACTKRLINFQTRERIFSIFNRDKPYILELTYKLQIPKKEYFVIMNATAIDLYSFTTKKEILFTNKKEIGYYLADLKRGKCLECGNIADCKFKTGIALL